MLNTRSGFDCVGGEDSQKRVAVGEASDEHLDQRLCCFRPDPADVVKSNSTRSDHKGDVGVAAQLVIQ